MVNADILITVGVLALQGAFSEHLQLLKKASQALPSNITFRFLEIRTKEALSSCDALIVPGGESTTMSLVAERSGLLEPLREFVKVYRKPVWGTCAGMILLAEEANRTKKGGQELIGGLDVRVKRNHFGSQTESFSTPLSLPFLGDSTPFYGYFIRAPIVEHILPPTTPASSLENNTADTVTAPSKKPINDVAASFTSPDEVKILGRLTPSKLTTTEEDAKLGITSPSEGRIVAVEQGNCFGTSFHPELGSDIRIHKWWLEKVVEKVETKRRLEAES
ncbi:hypothetical protein TWF225_001276 [Orbilia oligospora]|uniref:glutaminase n=1 Tax=Orbilia oligospora TaxID=2813651 RepID=A0A7C8KD36_ORBOL|nr:hypothetical protein TWF751_001367 [Orbilia oligospora]KAF3165247.1 hypothetical protein TWF225_001276 [Orbilia oligospora]KAF3236182.1 hypothetical protein TWF128_001473 [Orbilia oligospora]KAF3240593.1 hypothetical protein TWF217_000768 [Orbilia oligospora]KAF3287879.1 hypothetical protein TWF132_008257 [Orbilia oligospora]